jgi:hypothetical protein
MGVISLICSSSMLMRCALNKSRYIHAVLFECGKTGFGPYRKFLDPADETYISYVANHLKKFGLFKSPKPQRLLGGHLKQDTDNFFHHMSYLVIPKEREVLQDRCRPPGPDEVLAHQSMVFCIIGRALYRWLVCVTFLSARRRRTRWRLFGALAWGQQGR